MTTPTYIRTTPRPDNEPRTKIHVYCIHPERVLYHYKHGNEAKNGCVSRGFFDSSYEVASNAE